MTDRLGFVGLGVMGAPMAGHLLRAYGQITVWNRTASKADSLASEGAVVAKCLEDLATASDVILLCVNRTEDVRQCVDALKAGAREGTLFVDHSTIAPLDAVEIATGLESHGLRFVDAPITGGSMGAQRGQLTIFMGGHEADVEQAIEVVKPYTKTAARVGANGSGQMAKMANQIAVGGALLALCESLSFAKKAGLDLAQMKELIGGGAAGSWAFENYGPKILLRDWSPGFSIKNQLKDFGYCASAAKAVGAAIPGTLLVDRLLSKLADSGHAEWTTAALFEQLSSMGADD
jgi:3-hydroxyisobutyrate dehydrogenase-like beta-hydroxyacid dehydrogenase